MTLGDRIEKRLRSLGMSQAELARRAGVAQTTVNSLIKEQRRSSPHLLKFAAVLRTSPAYLAGETDDPSEDIGVMPFTPEELRWVDLLQSILPRERDSLLVLAEALARPARGPTLHAPRNDYRAG
jgi:transcriptional regulator with XRE-family HTH domain